MIYASLLVPSASCQSILLDQIKRYKVLTGSRLVLSVSMPGCLESIKLYYVAKDTRARRPWHLCQVTFQKNPCWIFSSVGSPLRMFLCMHIGNCDLSLPVRRRPPISTPPTRKSSAPHHGCQKQILFSMSRLQAKRMLRGERTIPVPRSQHLPLTRSLYLSEACQETTHFNVWQLLWMSHSN